MTNFIFPKSLSSDMQNSLLNNMRRRSMLVKNAMKQSSIASARDDSPRVTAVMPCLNEDKTVAICVTKALACFARLGLPGEVIVADNGSTDRSVALAEGAGARVVHVKTKGYGAALIAGITAARGKIIIMGDSDDSYDWSSLDGFIEGIEAGNDLVMGNRFRGGIEPGAMPPLHRYLGNPVLSLLSKLAFNVPIGDFHCGMRAFTQDAFRRMEPGSPGMEFATEMVANAAHSGLKIAEIPIKLYPDKRDRPPHLRSFRDGWRHLRYILSHAPDHVFVWPGVLMILAGMALVLALLRGPITIGPHYFGVHFIILGAMLCLIGATILPMGVLAKMILGLGPPDRSRILRTLLSSSWLLEGTLAIGGAALLCGLVVDSLLLMRWLNTASGMEDTVHLAIAGSTTIVIGIEIIFFAFVLFLARERLEKDNSFGSSQN
jgi:glycosyltransferase involved in cell wall biosynthesis